MSEIRNVTKQDIEALKAVIDSSELFPSELLEEMMIDYFSNQDTSELWFTKEEDSKPVIIAYCAPEKMTEGTSNLYLIAVRKEYQGKGLGAEMMKYVEDTLRERGDRVLLVETSGLSEFELTRKFYDQLGYHREAVIREFYAEGEDKVIFWKKL
ncbi:MAG: GNAT family N-acetyltransferase [Bacteroidota bacterium]